MSMITCKDLTLSYEGLVVVSDLTFTVEENDYLCIIGDNGTGKSTLMRTLLGLKRPNGGSVTFDPSLKRSAIGYLAQQTEVQKDFPASVWEVVLSGCLNQKGVFPFYTKADKEAAEQALATLEITDLKQKCYRELSGGQQQRVLLARAMLAANRLLVLDEPTTGLDPNMTTEFFSLVQRLNRENGVAVVMVTHDTHCAAKYSKHILHLKQNGYFYGRTADYLAEEEGRIYIGGHRHD